MMHIYNNSTAKAKNVEYERVKNPIRIFYTRRLIHYIQC